MAEPNKLVVVDEFNGKYLINEFYRPIADKLVEKFPELLYVLPSRILFVENTEDERKKNHKTVFAHISKIPGRWGDLIYQLTGKHFDYMIEIFKENIHGMSREQIIAVIYHELRHIQLTTDGEVPKVDLVGHDIDDFVNMIEKLGANWTTTRTRIPDLLDDNITNWDDILGPPTLFPEANLKLVK